VIRSIITCSTIAAIVLISSNLTACQPSDTVIYAQRIKLPEQAIKAVGQLPCDNNTQTLLNELGNLPAELQINEAVIKQLQNISADGKVSDDKLQEFRDLDQDGLSNADELIYDTNLLNPDTDADGLTDGQEVLTYKTDPLKPNPIIAHALKVNPDFSIKHLDVLQKIEADIDVGDNGQELVNVMIKYYPKVDENIPSLYDEIMKLPDFSRIEERDISASDEIFNLASNPKYREAFESMLNEGIQDERKYCTPLEALLWIAYDKEFHQNNPLDDYTLGKLLVASWQNTKESDNYKSERWKDLDIVRDRLNSIQLVIRYSIDNFTYDLDLYYRRYDTSMKTAIPVPWLNSLELFESKRGACGDQTGFVIDCLYRNGYTYDRFDINKDNAIAGLWAAGGNTLGHIIFLFIENGEYYSYDVSGKWRGDSNRGVKNGPFKSIHDAANDIMPGCGDSWALITPSGLTISSEYSISK